MLKMLKFLTYRLFYMITLMLCIQSQYHYLYIQFLLSTGYIQSVYIGYNQFHPYLLVNYTCLQSVLLISEIFYSCLEMLFFFFTFTVIEYHTPVSVIIEEIFFFFDFSENPFRNNQFKI